VLRAPADNSGGAVDRRRTMISNINVHVFDECRGAHSHEYPQIMIPLEGTMKITVGNAEYDVTTQDLCFIPAEMEHQCNYFGKLLALNISEDNATLIAYPMIISVEDLQKAIEHVVMSKTNDRPVVTTSLNRNETQNRPAANDTGSLNNTMHEIEYKTICSVLAANEGNITQSAKVMQMSRQSLQYRIKRFNIDIDTILHGARENV